MSWPIDKVRQTFINYFIQKGHVFVPSSPVVPQNDPTLLFANSGMNQFKSIFLDIANPLNLKRATNSQKCIRAGGKHNDLDDVGFDTYHHTFFEMLGNFSFGDYFREEVIDWAWELLTQIYGLDPKRIYVTYFKGDDKDNLPADLIARDLWKKYLPESRILGFGKKENFWEMGETGPCGPCSEIHYDRRSDRDDASEFVNADSPEVIEIWNLVFMTYNRDLSGKLTLLPKSHVDTGAGLERLTSILQDKSSNYDTDVFEPIFNKIRELTNSSPYTGLLGSDDINKKDTAYRIIADHIRTLVFAITDGAIPNASGRGYVLRRILRRAVYYGKQYLNAKDGFFHKLADTVIDKFGSYYTELKKDPERVIKVIKSEEEQFLKTLEKGINKFKRMKFDDIVTAEKTFLLYSNFGFPLDLIQIMAKERSLTVDIEGFELLKNKANEKVTPKPELDYEMPCVKELKELEIAVTDDSNKHIENIIEATIKFISDDNSNDIWITLDKTNFYAESGGQIYDIGTLNDDFIVETAKVYSGYVYHMGYFTNDKTFKVGDKVKCKVDYERRHKIMANHTTTHLTNFALHKVLGFDIEQRGSLVDDNKLRLDFTCPEALTQEQIQNVENRVNKLIYDDLPVYIQEMSLSDAKQIKGVQMVFTESYKDPVRVVSIGSKVSKDSSDFSIELCGGTHLNRTSEAGSFVIVYEKAIKVGERRIIAVTGDQAKNALINCELLQKKLGKLDLVPCNELSSRLQEFLVEFDELLIPETKRNTMMTKIKDIRLNIKILAKRNINLRELEGNDLIKSFEGWHGNVIVRKLIGFNTRTLADTAARIVETYGNVAVMLFTIDEKKGSILIAGNVASRFLDKIQANVWVNEIASLLGGKGGGTTSVSAGYGTNIGKIDKAIDMANKMARLVI